MIKLEFCILGFSQEKAIEYGLDVGDLIVLRWFIGAKNKTHISHSEETIEQDGCIYFHVNYQHLVEEFPIRKWSVQSIKKRFAKLVNKEILKRTVYRGNIYYTIAPKYLTLLFGDENI